MQTVNLILCMFEQPYVNLTNRFNLSHGKAQKYPCLKMSFGFVGLLGFIREMYLLLYYNISAGFVECEECENAAS